MYGVPAFPGIGERRFDENSNEFRGGRDRRSVTPSAAHASLVVNLRFANGSTTHTVTAADVGHDIEIDVWAGITGQNAHSSTNFFGLQYLYYNVVSSLPDGLGTGVNGTIDASANALVAPFNAPNGT